MNLNNERAFKLKTKYIATMQTRSQTQKHLKELEFNFDFDDASTAWKSNKKSIGNGCYAYVCEHVFAGGKKCDKVCFKDSLFCKRHVPKTKRK